MGTNAVTLKPLSVDAFVKLAKRAERVEAKNERLIKACEPIPYALRRAEPFECTDPDWNLDAHIEITVTVKEARALVEALKDGGRNG